MTSTPGREALAALRWGRGLAGLATVPVMAFVICLAPTRGVAEGRDPHLNADNGEYCSATAAAVFDACGNDVRADYSIARAICINVSDPTEWAKCFADAQASRREGNRLCRRQLAGRLEDH